MPHSHTGDGSTARAGGAARRALAVALAPFIVATAVGLLVLWPSTGALSLPGGEPGEQFDGTVTDVTETGCEDVPGQESFKCSRIEASIESGPDEGEAISFMMAEGPGTRRIEEGDAIVLGRSTDPATGTQYFFVDYQRRSPLVALALLFGAVVVGLSRWRGLAALAGLAVSLLILVRFVLPAILEGTNPLAVAVVGAAAIMFVTLYLAHGFNVRTSTALLGTLASLLLTGLLAVAFVEMSRFTGFGSEEAVFLQLSAEQINLRGLLLGGIIIGALGVLDDVTVTQASAVWELHAANPQLGASRIYRSALRIGRDHIASTVNTLVLAYAGASLPLLILFTLSNRPLPDILTGEIVAEEIVRTLVGSVGLVASVPITTGLAALVVARDATSVADEPEPDDFERPRAEREWRAERA